MNKEIKIKVGCAENGVTLQQLLAGRLNISRNAAKDIIDQRCVFVNDRRIWMARHCLKTGDNITGSFSAAKSPEIRRADILYEDNEYLIVNKPAGILSNGPNSVEQLLNQQLDISTLNISNHEGKQENSGLHNRKSPASSGSASALCGSAQGGKIENRKWVAGGARIGQLQACHRLDKDTSGCLIFAMHNTARERIIPLFANNNISKIYQTIIAGRLAEKSVTITKPLEGQRAITHVEVVSAVPAATHVRIQLETGRTHQIRKHLAAIGHPVLGDRQYGGSRALSPAERSIPRQMLHAAEISFVNPISGKSIHCRAALPDDFRECLKRYHLK